MNPQTKTTALLGLLIALVIVAGLLLSLSNIAKQQRALSVGSFEDCALAGYPIMESYPEQCRTPDGRTFVNDKQVNQMPNEGGNQTGGTFLAGSCVVAGCSGTICAEAGEASDIITTCEYRAEYACYKQASCERQASGKCGWTQTPQFKQCLAHPPALDSGVEVTF
jgi:hypothetical protein